ncbi:amino acid ABC transporter ATP-binding protein [Lactococcus plantarum]|uniref:Amino acid ABC transporter ATP-binding protein n=2 Tax=Pseudolactococcus plantarum TaxID=1365 RepID=A0A2A5RZR5_9LACT|nr:amino acid ABC transporter ATP-binding protein [Lactococcus plantarum]PCS06747.1 amino acid ABC transporter ATP-binding protein [Lactococcus plantarum]
MKKQDNYSAFTPRAEFMIDVQHLSKKFGKNEVLKDINLTVKRQEVVVLIGPSGSGKSTLIRCLNKLERASGGEICIMGKNIYDADMNNNYLRQKVNMVFQHFNLFANMTVLQNLTIGMEKLLRIPKEESKKRAIDLLKIVGLSDKHDMYPENLSGGQKQRVAIARALAMKPEIILFDEPTSALDPEMVGEVLQVMKEIAKTGTTMIVVTHEMGFAREVANKIVFLEKGELIAEMTPDELNANHSHPRIATFLKQIL